MSRKSTILCFFYFLSIFVVPVQSQGIPHPHNIYFYQTDSTNGVDVHSFAPLMILGYRVNRFYKLPKNPIFRPSRNGWDRRDVADPFVVVTADSIMLFYDGDADGQYHLGYAVLDAEGWFWKKRRMIFNGTGNRWDSYHQIAPVVLNLPQKWLLFYNGNEEDTELGYQTGLLQLNQGKWEPVQLEPILKADSSSWDFAGNAYGDVLYFPEQERFIMWYTGFQGPLASIGRAVSSDGIHWRREPENPVFISLPGVIAPEIIFDGRQYWMYFVQLSLDRGMQTRIRRASSPDGIHWSTPEDVLTPDEPWERGKLMRPNLSFYNGGIHLFYCAQKGSRWQIGEAIASVEFHPRGVWVSPVIPPGYSTLQIIFEKPPGTNVSVSLLCSDPYQEIPLMFHQITPRGRREVFEGTISLPVLDRPGDCRIKVTLTSEKLNFSPAVYQLTLFP